MKPNDLPHLTSASSDLWESVALGLAREERTLTELAERLQRQQASLANLRGLLLKTLWPRGRTTTEKEISS